MESVHVVPLADQQLGCFIKKVQAVQAQQQQLVSCNHRAGICGQLSFCPFHRKMTALNVAFIQQDNDASISRHGSALRIIQTIVAQFSPRKQPLTNSHTIFLLLRALGILAFVLSSPNFLATLSWKKHCCRASFLLVGPSSRVKAKRLKNKVSRKQQSISAMPTSSQCDAHFTEVALLPT